MQETNEYTPDSNWRILRDTAILSGAGSLFTLIKPLRAIVLGRVLGPYAYGLFNIPLPYIQLLSIFANLGLSAALLRMIALRLGRSDPAAARRLVRTGISIAFASSVLWSVVLMLLSPLLAERFASEPAAVVLIMVGAWMIPGITMIAVLSNIFLAYERGPLLGAIKSVYSLLGLLLPVALVLLFKQPLHVILSFVLVELSAAAIAVIQLYRRVLPPLPAAGPAAGPVAGPLLRLAHSFFYTNLGWMLINSADRIMIQWYCETEILGFYAVAVFFVNFLNIIPMNFTQVITPSLTKGLARGEIESAWTLVRDTTRVVSFILAPLVVFGAVFSNEIVIVLFSDAFSPAGLFLRILAFGALLNYICKLSWHIIISDDDPGKRSLVYIIAAAINVGLNFLLIPRFGAVGAAAASLLAYAVLASALQLFLHRKMNRNLPFKVLLPPFVIAAVAVPVSLLLPLTAPLPRLIAGLAVSLLFYLLLCTTTGIIRKRDLSTLIDRTRSFPAPLAAVIGNAARMIRIIARN